MKRRVAETHPGSGGFLKYQLLMDLGEIAPVVRSAKGVLHDTVHHIERRWCARLRRYRDWVLPPRTWRSGVGS